MIKNTGAKNCRLTGKVGETSVKLGDKKGLSLNRTKSTCQKPIFFVFQNMTDNQ